MSYSINQEKVLFTQLGDEGVIYDIEKNDYLSVNETFFKILQGVEKGQTNENIAIALSKEYDISIKECLIEIEGVISKLKNKNFIA